MSKVLYLLLVLQLLGATNIHNTSLSEQPSTTERQMQKNCTEGQNDCVECNNERTECVTCRLLEQYVDRVGACAWNYCPSRDDDFLYVDPGRPGCRRCHGKFNLCDWCTWKGCTTCKHGYYVDPIMKHCSRCNSGCGDCIDSSSCIRCMEPFSVPYSDGSCPTNNFGTFYNPSTGHIEFCPKGCKHCDINGCIECWARDATNYGLFCRCDNQGWKYTSSPASSSCQIRTIPEGCDRHSFELFDYWGSVYCHTCKPGFFKEGHQCSACGLGCGKCKNRNSCESCFDPENSYIVGNQCIFF
ncbi:unnamed protein product [Blepharisma stoltei]|uniref:Uncharacterized protein n=1 Tax=Blepharisma stoltei TaxID=1481888 RepID=A0AAU9J221_9CILI|nr:unnamed protein product [Blepharisma stoltei]